MKNSNARNKKDKLRNTSMNKNSLKNIRNNKKFKNKKSVRIPWPQLILRFVRQNLLTAHVARKQIRNKFLATMWLEIYSRSSLKE